MNKNIEQDLIRALREAHESKLRDLDEAITPVLHKDIDGDSSVETLISSGLKIKHTKSGIRYTVDSVGPNDVLLLTPEGEKFSIDRDQLEAEYELC